MREAARQKADRYLLEGRVVVVSVRGSCVVANVRGEGAIYRVESIGPETSCTCPARGTCAHVLAIHRITAPGGTP